MRKNISQVIEAFEAGKSCNKETIHTDGKTIFSYSMAIATYTPGVGVVVVSWGPTRTTNSHINALLKHYPRCVQVEKI